MLKAVNNKINNLLSKYKVKIDAFYFCPAHPDYSSEKECECRKPSPKLVFEAAKEFNVELTELIFYWRYCVGCCNVEKMLE